MRNKVQIERRVVWLCEERKWEARVIVRLQADEDGHLYRVFRNKNKELIGEKLSNVWGIYVNDKGNEWREKYTYEVFDNYNEAVDWTELKSSEIISELNIVIKENLKMTSREFSQIEEYEVDEERFGLVREENLS